MTAGVREETMFELVKALTEIPGPTGHEDAVQDWLVERWQTFSPDVRRTKVNNILARVGGSGPRIVLFAHADEICLMVKSVTDTGFLHLWPYYGDVDGHLPTWFTPVNQHCLVVSTAGTIPGVIATASGHVVGGRNSKKERLAWNDIFVDLGANSRAEVEALGIGPGSRVVWNPPTRRLGANYVGKAMDDRAPLAIITAAAEALANRHDLAYEVWLASTVQEENGLIGAASLADTMPFDAGIAVDVGLTGDIPGPDPRDFPARLGAGPTIVYQDATCHYHRPLSDALIAAAAAASIPVQRAIFQNYGSDGASTMRRGIPSALLTCPTRYTHSPIETVSEQDLLHSVDLLVAFLTTSPAAVDG